MFFLFRDDRFEIQITFSSQGEHKNLIHSCHDYLFVWNSKKDPLTLRREVLDWNDTSLKRCSISRRDSMIADDDDHLFTRRTVIDFENLSFSKGDEFSSSEALSFHDNYRFKEKSRKSLHFYLDCQWLKSHLAFNFSSHTFPHPFWLLISTKISKLARKN